MNIERFFEEQLAVWPEARKRYDDLKTARHKTVSIKGRDYDVMYNPARMVSAAAKVDGGKVERPCFLCDHALPKEQRQMKIKTIPRGREYNIMVNPFPITDRHFTIVSAKHERQTLADRVWDMAYLADLLPDYLIFFNGACSGASAPDHMHFQAVPKALVPVTHWTWDQWQDMGVTSQMPKFENPNLLRPKDARTEGSNPNANPDLNLNDPSDQKNVICWTDGQDCHWLVIDRKCHRPKEYFMEGEEQVIVSPAALEFCGLVPIAREVDFVKMNEPLLSGILAQCRSQEPMIHVGIMEGQQIRFSAEERTHSLNYLGEDKILQVMDYGSNRAEKREISEYQTTSTPFTLEGVTIGKQFHWEQQEDQTFMGSLRVIAKEGQLHAINIISVEEYLKSVISSEMSATNNLELLKTHAIISRSWVLKTLSPTLSREEKGVDTSGGRFLKIWDGNDHTLYDVCADDHCQRYQGITRQVSPLVAQAIEETRGMVLMDRDGQICDARFSKCCGGKSELFSSCWQDVDFHYLQPVDDPWCDTHDERVLRLVLNGYDQKTVDFHDWEVSYTQKQLTELFNRRMQGEYPDFQPLANITALNPVKRGPSGRIYELEVVGLDAEGTEVRLSIGKELLIRKALSESHLYSSAFDVLKLLNPETAETSFVLKGKGWGHGVGLCQIGAANMSQHGKNYEEILLHYFVGAKVEKLY